jgi:hypothetical protein
VTAPAHLACAFFLDLAIGDAPRAAASREDHSAGREIAAGKRKITEGDGGPMARLLTGGAHSGCGKTIVDPLIVWEARREILLLLEESHA